MHENGKLAMTVNQNRAVPSRRALARPSNPLLNDCARQISVDQSPLSAGDRFAQSLIGDPLLKGELRKLTSGVHFHGAMPS